MASPKEVIEKIRREEFYIGTGININSINRKFNNALETLSEDLYADEIHFVLELIQNADDNEYEVGKIPVIIFTIDKENILVQNNERGFTEKNIRALSSVRETTKTKKEGYIGEKGIGFKSVFRISDEPQIFSNGFQFKFKSKDEELGLGYIVPHWIDNPTIIVNKTLTNILLPLNNKAKEDLPKFDEIKPELLLFLRKLCTVEIHNKIDNSFLKFSKKVKNGIVKIESIEKEEFFRLVEEDLYVPERIQEEKRKLEKTKLVLGFPINENGTAKTTSQQKVFAFLPTKEFGFKFIIQADFLVPASREDIYQYTDWNKWLRDNVPNVFLKAIETFKKDDKLKSTFYNYIPTESEITNKFFSGVVRKLKNKLLDSNCVLTESGKWLKPSEVFRASEDIRSLIPNKDLFEHFGKEYISREVESNNEKRILNFLEIATFSPSDLIELLKNTEWLEKQTDEWLIELYNYLKSNLSKSEKNAVKKLRIVRLQDGLMESPTKKIFFQFRKKQVYGFEKQLPFIKEELVKAKEFLQDLGVLNPQPFEIIENHILRDFEDTNKNQNWQSKTEEVRIGYINYIKDNLVEYEKENNRILTSNKSQYQQKDPLERLKNAVWIRCKSEEGRWFRNSNTLYLSKEYENENNLEFLLSGIEDVHFVHPQYFQLSKKEIEENELDKPKRKEKLNRAKKDWADFFIRLGVETKPIVFVNPTNQYGYRNTIYQSPIINRIIKEGNTEKNLTLLKILDFEWDYYKQFTTNTIYYLPYNDGRYNHREKKENSEWYVKITNTKWLPAKNKDFEEPSKLFLDKPEIRKILGNTVSYLDVEIENEEFRRALNIISEVKVETVLQILKRLVIAKSNDKERFEKLYSFLNENYQGSEVQITTHFQDGNLIFIPEISNEYISSRKALWKDVSEIFGDYRHYLENYYPKLKNFFVQKIGIPEKPTAENYADILGEISIKGSIEKSDERKIKKIYKELNRFLKTENSKDLSIIKTSWWKSFITKNIFWTNKSEFWRNDNDVFINDDEELYELFKHKSDVDFLKFPQDENPELAFFIKETGLKYLSKSIETQIETSVECDFDEKLTKEINNLSIYIVRYIYHKENEIYEKAKEDGRLLNLINLLCYGVLDLNVEYILHTDSVTKDSILFLDENKLYVKIDDLEDYERVSMELSKMFGSPKGLSDFIENLFSKPYNDKRDESLKKKKIGDLPKSERDWFEKNSAQRIDIKITLLNSNDTQSSDGEIQGNNLVPENGGINDHNLSEYNHQSISHQENTKNGSNQIETESSTIASQPEIPITNYLRQAQPPLTRNENVIENDWNAQVEPSEVESDRKEVVIPKFIPSNPPTNRNVQPDSTSSAMGNENTENSKDRLSQEAKRRIGRWGEEFAVEKLREKFVGKYTNCKLQEKDTGFHLSVNNQTRVEINWLNKFEDKGIGRDIEFIENGETYFIEVKATKTDSKEIIQISRNEWQLAKEKHEKFSIFRVYNAGTNQARCEEICNPYQEWLEGRLSVQSLTVGI